MTIRFRKWSRKAYAAFASLGRCVTIGYLPKNVADCSLSKQNSGTSAGCKSGGQNLEDTDNGKGQETLRRVLLAFADHDKEVSDLKDSYS